jgi:Cation transport protein
MGLSFKAVWDRIKPHVPDLFTKGRFNFITIHYLYISGMTLLGSVLIFAIGGMPYIDALFFASGAATQSGLNTVDINTIHTGQQFLLYIMAMLCNPIVINSSVVFVRLYWFEKRFKHVVKEARALRRSKSRSRVTSKAKDDPELGRIEKGVRGKSIVVLRDGHSLEGSLEEEEELKADAAAESVSSSSARNESAVGSDGTLQSEVPVERRGAVGDDDGVPDFVRSPQHLNVDHHIAFLENQRSPIDKGMLRIPSPREFDRGGKPEDVGDEETAALTRKATSRPDAPHFDSMNFGRSPQTANHITINEPKVSRSRDKATPFPKVDSEKAGSVSSSAEPSASLFSKVRSRRGTNLKDLIQANTNFLRSKEEEEPKEEAPYLSWVPTIVRNSAFVNLNEEQREELGGIEYRALKTLAIVLIAYFLSFHILGVIILTPWILRSATYGSVVTEAGQGRPWWGVFSAASVFNDLGFTLTADSMISFGSAVFPMLLMTFLIIIGNTGFPCMLRFVIWFTSKVSPRGTALWEELQFLLDHPRRCFTLLFPKAATWWLFAILIVLNTVDLIFFVILDVSSSSAWGIFSRLTTEYSCTTKRSPVFHLVSNSSMVSFKPLLPGRPGSPSSISQNCTQPSKSRT